MSKHIHLSNIPNMTVETRDGRTYVSMPGAFGLPVTCEYWKEDNVRSGDDAWRFQFSHSTEKRGHRGPYSHPSEAGCQIAIRRWFLDTGLIPVPEDNSHLDELDQVIAAKIAAAYASNTGRPRVGDFVIFPDGSINRCAYAWEYGMQTCKGGSFSTGTHGGVSMSGSLDKAWLWESFEDTGETRKGRFWFFSHNLPGAGRGVDVFLSCRVYRLVPKERSEGEAKKHPKALDILARWPETSEVYVRTIREIMSGRGS